MQGPNRWQSASSVVANLTPWHSKLPLFGAGSQKNEDLFWVISIWKILSSYRQIDAESGCKYLQQIYVKLSPYLLQSRQHIDGWLDDYLNRRHVCRRSDPVHRCVRSDLGARAGIWYHVLLRNIGSQHPRRCPIPIQAESAAFWKYLAVVISITWQEMTFEMRYFLLGTG